MAAATAAAAALAALAIVAQDQTALRAAPSAHAAVHAQLTAGDLLELRGQRLDHWQVYDHRRERAGYVRASQVRRIGSSPADAPQLLAVLRFLRDTPGAESLGIAYAAAYLKAAPAEAINAEPFDALGVLAERLARRAGARPGAGATATSVASSVANSVATSAATSAALDAVAAYGVKFVSLDNHQGQVRLCYDGEAFRRVLAQNGSAEQRARAALALTRHDCVDPDLKPSQRLDNDRWRAGVLDSFSSADAAALDEPTRNRLRLRRAGVWAAIAFGDSRRGVTAQPAAQRALDELAAVNKAELGDDEQADAQEAAIRVGAVRWAALPAPALPLASASAGLASSAAAAPAATPPVSAPGRLQVALAAGEPGQTCVHLVDSRGSAQHAPRAQRCTYGTVWLASAQPSADGRALALAVQPLEAWTELWLFRASADGWTVDVLPPAAAEPGLGYVEFAGWVPAAKRRLLLAREAKVDGALTRRFEVLDADTLAVDKSASSPQRLAAFGAWAAPGWRRMTLSVR